MSDPMAVSRKLVAVFAADVEGYSRLMGADEVGTLKGLTERRAILDGLIGEHRGRIANTAGDSVLAEFGSAVDAVQCAVEAQDALAEANSSLSPDRRISFRIGIHIGDVMVRAGDLFGDGVNIAARLQSIASPGAVFISGATYDQVRKVLPITFADLGAQQVKNIQEPIRAYQVGAPSETQVAASEGVAEAESPPPLPDKPSIAVLPFENLSGDPEQAYFADGMVEEIITALSRFKWLFVIARNSSFTFKGRAVDVKEVGRKLGVRYVLEGSVRKSSGKVRITGQLIDAVTGTHLWADRFERDLTDVFALQDEVTVAVVSAVEPKLRQTEIAMAARRRPENHTAYDLYLRAMQLYYLATREGVAEAMRLAHRALKLDPGFGRAAALAGNCHMQNVLWGYAVDPQFDRNEAVRLSRLALSIDDGDADTLARAGIVSAFVVGDSESEIELVDRAVALNPNSFHAWLLTGLVAMTALGFITAPIAGALSDRIGRRKVYIAGCVFVAAYTFVYFALLDTKAPELIFLAIALSFIPVMTMYGPQAALIAEAFTPRLRYSGASIGYQLASIIAGGPAPFVSTFLFSTYHSALPIGLYVSVCAAISICAALLLPDQTNKDIAHEVNYGNA